MHRSSLAALTALAVGALSLAVQASGSQAADTPAAVTIEAAPKWGVARAGSWTPYTVTLHNGGTVDIDGEVVLAAQPEAAPDPGAPTTTTSVPATPTSTTVLAIGGRAITSPPPVGAPPSAPEPAWPSYRAAVALPAGTDKTLTIMVFEAPFGFGAELLDHDGRRVAMTAPPEPTDPLKELTTLLLLSTVAGAEDTIEALPQRMTSELDVIQMQAGGDFPDSALHLAGLDAVVIDDFDPGTLTPAQLRAIQDYVSLGGTLLITGGAAGPRMLRSIPEGLAPLQATGTLSTSLAPLAELASETTAASATVVNGQVVSGRVVLAAPGGPPLVIESDYGAGHVVLLTYDPLAEPFTFDTLLRGLAWDQGLARSSTRFGGISTFSSNASAARVSEDQVWGGTLGRRSWPSWPRWPFLLLFLYTLTAGFAIFALSRGRRPAIAAMAVTLVVMVTAASSLAGSAGRKDTADTVIEVRALGADGAVLTTSYRGLLSLDPRERVPLTAGVAASTLYSDRAVFSPTRQEPAALDPLSPESPVPPGLGRGVVETTGSPPAVVLSSRPWALRTVQTVAIGHDGPVIEADLRLVGSSKASPGRVTGTVTNRGSEALRGLRAQIPEGQAQLGARLAPGETVEVDAPVLTISTSHGGDGGVSRASELLPSTRDDVVMAAVASRSFTGPGQVAIVGIADPEATSKRDADRVAVVVTLVALKGAETVITDTGGARAVALSIKPGGESSAAFDAMVLPGTGPLSLRYGAAITFPGSPPPGPSSVEVYNWTTGTWRSLPTVGHPSFGWVDTPVDDAEVKDGVVRVRQRVSSGMRLPGAQLILRSTSEETEAALAPIIPR